MVPRLGPLDETRVEVPETSYPGEVLCRKCRHLTLPDDAEGRSWTCWVCGRRILVVLRPPE
jgi:DNA-directed RNA polymerase subunit RPC12/RpoP